MKIDQMLLLNQIYKFNDSGINALFSGEETVVIYYPELGVNASGKNFVNKLRKKGIFNEVLIPPMTTFINRKSNNNNYIKEFRALNPNVKVVPSFRNFIKGKINLIDLTPLSELYFLQTRNLSKFKLTQELIDIFNRFSEEYNKKTYLLIGAGQNEIDNIFLEILFKIARKKGFKFESNFLKIDGAIISKVDQDQQFEWYPLIQKKDKELIFKFNIYSLFQKNYKTGFKDTEEIEDLDRTTEEGIIDKEKEKENIRNQILELSDKLLDKHVDIEHMLKTGEKEEALDSVYELINNDSIEGDTTIEKINNLFKDKDKKTKKKIKNLIDYLEEVNKQFNGALKLNNKLLNESSNSYFDPQKIIKLEDLTGYKKHATEFDKLLDHSMFDLIKSIEKDKEAGIKVENIKTEIYDTNTSRFKKYVITFKNTDTENKASYTQELIVPYPIKEKYFKIDGVNYIMINQFFPKPILKVKPNMVRLYTHFSTFSVWLSTHILDESQDIGEFTNVLLKLNKKAKVSYIDNEKLNKNIENFDIPFTDITLINKKIEF